MVLTREQRHLLKKWVRLNRKAYNLAIEYLNQHQGFDVAKRPLYEHRTGIGGTGKQAFKTFFKAQIRPDWLKKELPAAILDQAVMEAYSAWSKTKKNPKYVGKGKNKKPHPKPDYTPEVTYKNGNFYLSLPQDTKVEDNGKESFIAFDPGVRTFLTGFDGNQFINLVHGSWFMVHSSLLTYRNQHPKNKEQSLYVDLGDVSFFSGVRVSVR